MLEILYRDDHLVAIHKPAGLLVHRSELDRHETRFAVQLLRDQIGRVVYPAHRLDRGTSGVLLFALDRAVLSNLSLQFELQSVEKTYVAIVRGWPAQSGVIDHPLQKIQDDYECRAVAVSSPAAQNAITHFECLATVELPVAVDRYATSRYALMHLTPRTGRRHQLRRHLKHIAHPIIGDATYGKGRHNRSFQNLFGCQRMLLACTGLRFVHPANSMSVQIEAPLAEDFVAVNTALGWKDVLSRSTGEDAAR